MVSTDKSDTGRKARSDGAYNRKALLLAAKTLFSEKGGAVRLDEVARLAGVGNGTLYRHFPNRDALISAVYSSEVEDLAAAAEALAKSPLALEGLRQWLYLFVEHVAAKNLMMEALNSLSGGKEALYEQTNPNARDAIDMLVSNAVRQGEMVAPVEPFGLLWAISGMASGVGGEKGLSASRELVDILLAGLQTARF